MGKKDKKLIKEEVARQLAILGKSKPRNLKPSTADTKIVTTQLFADHEYKYVTNDLVRIGIIISGLTLILAGFFIINSRTNFLITLAKHLLDWIGF